MFFDPLTYGLFHAGLHLWVIVILLGLCFWGFGLGLLRKLRSLSRKAALIRRPGVLYCPECLAALEPGGGCPGCQGKWLPRTQESWRAYPADAGAKTPKPCPKCGAAMEAGAFLEKKFTVERCTACAGCWLTRIDRVSYELGL